MNPNLKLAGIAALGVFAVLALYGLVTSPFFSTPGETSASPPKSAAAPATGRVTMIDLGATDCIPCKMMAPIIEELKAEYAGKADIVFIDVLKNREQAQKYGIRAIPTQIFFDGDGREVYRHTGFMDKKSIVERLRQLGVE
ncbi:MAG: thioredoxin family protein [Desulfobacterales bacterium]|nr:thioredoxin family protein [Desulfobacterales bacterium]